MLNSKQEYQLCYYTGKLFKPEDILIFEIKNRGYGSLFDEENLKIKINKYDTNNLIENKLLDENWFNNDKMYDKHNNLYKNEKQILNLISILNNDIKNTIFLNLPL